MATLPFSVVHNPLPFPIKTLTTNRIHSRTPIPRPIFCSQKISLSSSLNPKILVSHCQGPRYWTAFKEGAAVLILGSLFFLGRFSGRLAPALADPPRETMQEKAETQKVEEENEEDLHAKLLERDPTDVEALKLALYAKIKKGKRAEAVSYLERLISLEPDEIEWRLLQALSYELMGNLGMAKKLFKEILKERPLLLRALHGLALAMYKNKEGPAAFDMLNKALALAHREKRVTEERSIKILIAQMHVVKLTAGCSLLQGIIYSLLDKKKEADEQFEIYQSLIPDEFPHRGFIDDVVLTAKTVSPKELKKDIQ
ncbi:hypothetical protein AXF42_Ash011290 [Apostasia shenzhenica]|uniref:Uncharacterized protein n=1 Tax=Apostasia shenzhenica TaxID=1088818 RepID=A0A2I0AE34_9ASPA|nr:hypothetical protein AXF42_Ash011290 [Apostasia shenzhenica]